MQDTGHMYFCSYLLRARARSFEMLALFLVVALLGYMVQADLTTDLSNTGLTAFPGVGSIPSETTTLRLDYNQIAFVPEGSLCHTQLKVLRIDFSELRSMGNLSCVGQSLRTLYVRNNLLTTVPASAFAGLDALTTLDISQNQLTEFPDLWDVADTLIKLSLINNPDMGGLPPSETLAQLTALEGLIIHNSGETQLSKLIIFADQLKQFSFGTSAEISQVKPEELRKLTKLQFIRLFNTDVKTITDLTNSASTLKELVLNKCNQLQELPRKDLSKFYGLLRLSIVSMNMKQIPCTYSVLERINMEQNQLTDLPRMASCAQDVILERNSFSRIQGRHAATLRNFNRLRLKGNPLERLEDVLDLERNPTAIIELIGIDTLDLCKCEHVWLKIAEELGADIQMTDVQCGDSLWSALTSTQLLERCDEATLTESNASPSTGWSVIRPKAASCQLPVHAYYSSVLKVHCARRCFSRQGRCVAYKFRLTGGRFGNCQLLEPTSPDSVISVPDRDEAGWKCFTASPDIS